ncbi:MAG: YHYH protein, partial [Burkholderiales bacterium]
EYEVTHPVVMKLVGVPEILQGHVQPSGMFHYHGYSATLIDPLRERAGEPDGVQLVGYSADGFPIIDCNLVAKDGRKVRLESGWRLRQGRRTAQPRTNPALTPSGDHDGLYVQDYEFAPRAQRMENDVAIVPLDRRNGIVLGDDLPVLAGFPARHYAYVLTPDWPMIPRFIAYRPDQSFADIIPMTRGGQAGRSQLYDACGVKADAIRGLDGRERY